MLKLVFEKPKIPFMEGASKILKGEDIKKKKSKAPIFSWGIRERFVVGAVLFLTLFLGALFWYKGQGKFPSVQLPKFDFSGRVELR